MAVMRLYLQMGDRAAALRQFEQFRRLLKEQLGLELSQEMKAFGAQMLAGRLAAPVNNGTNPWAEPPLVGREPDIFWLGDPLGAGPAAAAG